MARITKAEKHAGPTQLQIEHDAEADAIYVTLSRQDVARTVEVRPGDVNRMVDYAADDDVVGVELLSVSHGVDLTGVPQAAQIAAALRARGIHVDEPQPA
jgi:uncharacterized protein YuzE